MFNLLSKFFVTSITYDPHKFGNTHIHTCFRTGHEGATVQR